ATRITYFDRERTEFSSPEAAQQWFEWRRGAYLFPWFSFALGLALVLVLPNAAGAIEQRFIISFFVLGVAPAVVASLVGYVVTRPGSDYQWFVGARPLDTATIARARLRAGLKAVLWAYVLLGMLFVVSFKIMFWGDPIIPSVVADFHTITSTHGPFGEGLMAVALLSAFAVLTSWSLFWLARMAGVAVMLSGAAIASWLYLKGGGLYAFDADTGTVTSPITPGILLMAGIAAALGVCAIVAAMRRGYIRVPVLAGSLIAWLLLIFLGLRLEAVIPFGGPLVIGAWMLLPFIPLASIPLTLEWQRHR
ncbi:MAG: hypothetical protein KJ052_06280, partial [Candidatus Hydrogenedentes bacterium]|nr:hypothetical protein [Candidatus Hydrogenedentota bacterium]